jgi:ribosomal-protein-alanine N-acetyltransferase
MTEALQLFVDHLFDTKPVVRLQLTIAPENEASKAVAKKVGFTFEGVARGSFYVRGAPRDMEIWAILNSDPRSTPGE